MKAILLTIGNEVLNGQVVDTNAAWIAQALLEIGIPIREKWSVADEISEIIYALENASPRSEIIITTGGLGPTVDDLTCEALAQFMGVQREFHTDTFDKLNQIFTSIGRIPTESHRIQCLLPKGVQVLPNINGTAPGMYFFYKNKHFISLPGVPFEMKGIFHPHVKNLLETLRTGPKRRSHTFNTIGEGETFLEDLIKDITQNASKSIGFAFLPDLYKVRIRVDLDSTTKKDIENFEEILARIRSRLVMYTVGENDQTLELAIGKELLRRNWMMATAESCTGGYISHLITSNSGSSNYYKGSVIAYSNEMKTSLLGVKVITLEEEGAVSDLTVLEMATGAIKALHVEVAIAISGIAGPGGGTVEKPVGLVWIAVADIDGKQMTKKIQLRRDRLLNIRAASNMALITLYKFLMNE